MNESTWNVETLKESVEQRFAENQKAVDIALSNQEKAVAIAFVSQEKSVSTALQAAKEAVVKAEILTDKRFDAVSEAVSQVSTKTSDLLPRAEYAANHKALDDKIEVINNVLNKTTGDRNLYVTFAELDSKLTIVVERMESTMKPIIEYVNRQQGSVSGSRLTMGRLFAVIAATGVIIGVIVSLITAMAK